MTMRASSPCSVSLPMNLLSWSHANSPAALPTDNSMAVSLYSLRPARYPRGLRERSAKPPFVGSNPTRASKTRAVFCFSHRYLFLKLRNLG